MSVSQELTTSRHHLVGKGGKATLLIHCCLGNPLTGEESSGFQRCKCEDDQQVLWHLSVHIEAVAHHRGACCYHTLYCTTRSSAWALVLAQVSARVLAQDLFRRGLASWRGRGHERGLDSGHKFGSKDTSLNGGLFLEPDDGHHIQ